MTKAFYREWRPATWAEVIGQDHVVQTLKNAIASKHLGHAYLFSGPRGIGKTTVARLLAKAVNCTNPDAAQRPDNTCPFCEMFNQNKFMDLIEIDAASNTSVEDVRDLRDKINYKPSTGEYKIYIIDEVHMLSTAAFNALLKTLEEPPPHAIFILATTEVQKIPATVISRCQRYEFRRIPVTQIVDYLKEKTKAEKIQVSEDALTLIARQATGSMRDAVSLLDQLASTGEEITLARTEVVLGTAANQKVIDLVDALIARKSTEGLQIIQQALDSGTDPRQFARQTVDYLRNLLLIKSGNASQVDTTKELKATLESQAAKLDTPAILDLLKAFNRAANEMRNNWQPGLLLEMALVEYTEPEPAEMPSTDEVSTNKTASKKPISTGTSVREPESEPVKKPIDAKPMVKPNEVPDLKIPASALASSSELDGVVQKWATVVADVKKINNKTAGLLNTSHPMIKSEGLVIAFTSDVLKNMMESSENISALKKVLNDLTGKEVNVKCIVSSAKSKTSAADLGVDSDGLVGTALNQGGHVVHKD